MKALICALAERVDTTSGPVLLTLPEPRPFGVSVFEVIGRVTRFSPKDGDSKSLKITCLCAVETDAAGDRGAALPCDPTVIVLARLIGCSGRNFAGFIGPKLFELFRFLAIQNFPFPFAARIRAIDGSPKRGPLREVPPDAGMIPRVGLS